MLSNKCQICFEGYTNHQIKQETYTFKGYELTINQSGLWCDCCGEGILNGDDIKSTEQQIENFKKDVKSKIAQDIKTKRKKLNITQKQAAEICGGGIRAFHKYEKGEILPSNSTINLLTILSNHPNLLEEIHPENIN